MLFAFAHPFRLLLTGVSGCGKSTLLAEIIKRREESIAPPPEKILYFVRFAHSVPEEIRELVEIHTGLPTKDQIENTDRKRVLIVLDDLQNEAMKSPIIISAFQTSRHSNISIIFLMQNLFARAARSRDITLNCTHIIIFFNPRDQGSTVFLGRQVDYLHPMILPGAFFNYIDSAYKYLLVDVSPLTPQHLRYRSEIFSPGVEIFVSNAIAEKIRNNEANTPQHSLLHIDEIFK